MSSAIDAFLGQYYARHPVNATYTGVHTYDGRLPDWSRDGLAADAAERLTLRAALNAAHPAPPSTAALRDDPQLLDAELARANLDVRDAEYASEFFHARNPALWTGELVFGAVSLMTRPFGSLDQQLNTLAERLKAIPAFVASMHETIAGAIPATWLLRASSEVYYANTLLTDGVTEWLDGTRDRGHITARVRVACRNLRKPLLSCVEWFAQCTPGSAHDEAAGEDLYAALLRHGHFCDRSADDLLREAQDAIGPAKQRLRALSQTAAGSWERVQKALAADVRKGESYYRALHETWEACRSHSAQHDLVTWPSLPVRYVPTPKWASASAPHLYWLWYRSPAAFDALPEFDYSVAPGWNMSTIKLNHVVHHGALGHHVQNWHATHRSRSRIGTVAAIDGASRIGMFLGGSMAEGWACYATELMDECGFLSPLEQAAQQHGRVRMLGRAIVDIQFHHGRMTSAEALSYYVNEVGMSEDVAWGEVTKNSMFPGTAVMYWLGTKNILDLRTAMQCKHGNSFTLRSFHDELLSYGSIPTSLVSSLMSP